MKKRLTICMITLLLIASLNGGIKTFAMETVVNTPTYSAMQATIEPRAERTETFYRVYNGVKQMRIWSYGQNKWITEWTNV